MTRSLNPGFPIRALTAKAATLVTAMVLTAVVSLGAGSAHASTNVTTISRSGTPGYVRVGDTTCLTDESNPSIYTSAPFTMTTKSPTVYGLTGYSQSWVTFRLSVFDVTAGKPVTTTTWAPNVAATPTAPATWTLQGQWSSLRELDVRHRYVARTEVWWYANGAWRASYVAQENLYNIVTYLTGSWFQVSDSTCHNRWYSTLTNTWYNAS